MNLDLVAPSLQNKIHSNAISNGIERIDNKLVWQHFLVNTIPDMVLTTKLVSCTHDPRKPFCGDAPADRAGRAASRERG